MSSASPWYGCPKSSAISWSRSSSSPSRDHAGGQPHQDRSLRRQTPETPSRHPRAVHPDAVGGSRRLLHVAWGEYHAPLIGVRSTGCLRPPEHAALCPASGLAHRIVHSDAGSGAARLQEAPVRSSTVPARKTPNRTRRSRAAPIELPWRMRRGHLRALPGPPERRFACPAGSPAENSHTLGRPAISRLRIV